MRIADTGDQWWLTSTGYCLDVERWFDSDGDGHGDLIGVGRRLDHLQRLGVGFIWLQPFFPSPEGDDGYDVSDYYAVDPAVGSLGDVVELVRAARERGIRVLMDLIVNHTSVEHRWFREARADKGSRYRDWYVWRDEPDPADDDIDLFFPDREDSVWQYDDVAGQYFRHRFYRHQPDLNTANPAVREEILRIMGFWLELGVAGFRVDAAPYFVDTAGRAVHPGTLDDPFDLLDDMRVFLDRRGANAILLGEVNRSHEVQQSFFGGVGDRFDMLFDFVLNQALYLALARRDVGPLLDALRSRPELPRGKAFGTFVRNHDELSLDQLTAAERGEVLAAFGPDPDHQIFGRGLRRRLPTMLDGDRDRIAMVYSLLFSLPGTPVLYYGEEIGQGENLDLEARLAVRTTMQWDARPGGGFSTTGRDATGTDGAGSAPPTGAFAPEHVNVADQLRDPSSLLAVVRRYGDHRRTLPEFGRGTLRLPESGHADVLVHELTWDGHRTVVVHSLTDAGRTVTVGDLPKGDVVLDLLGECEREVDDDGTLTLELGRYGVAWLRVEPTEGRYGL